MKHQIQSSKPILAVDIGGTKIMTAVFSPAGKLLVRDVIPTNAEEGLEIIFDRMCVNLQELLARSNLKMTGIGCISIAVAGGVDTARGIVVTPSPHLPGWKEAPLAAMFTSRFGVDTYVLNDASAAALGEHRYGAGVGVKHLVLFTLGTGVGGGIIIDDKLYLGAVGGAGEFGHMTVEAHGPKCPCGNTGCLEMLVSGSAIQRDVGECLARGEKSTLADIAKKSDNGIRVEDVEAAAREGDKLALSAIGRASFYLGIGFVNIINIFNPELIIYGGGMAEMGEMLIGPARKIAEERPFSINARAVRIVKAGLANEAGIYGAAAFGLDMMRRKA